jgi:selenocysteine lyase/cysteine desulfurase
MAGCHKWLFGPRGTGIVAATPEAWARLLPTIPTYSDREVFGAWLQSRDPQGPTTAAAMTPGGFKPFEHRWALPEAFAFQAAMGKARVAGRTHELASQLKDGLARMSRVALRTPRAPSLSSGIVAFDVEGLTAAATVARLRERGIVASVSPYAVAHARLTPCVRNTPAEIDHALAALRDLAGR